MSALFIADVHLGDHAWCRGAVRSGISERAQEGLDALARAVELAISLRVDSLVILGDLFDSARPAPALLAAAQHVLARAPSLAVLVGNHDQESEQPGHHACAPLHPLAWIVDDLDVVHAGNLDVVLAAPRSSLPALAGTRDRLLVAAWPDPAPGRVRVLGLHLGLADEGTPVHLREANDAILARAGSALGEAIGASLVIAGNWHWPNNWAWSDSSCAAVQIGTLAPHDFRDAGQAGWAIEVQDSGAMIRHEIAGPRFHKYDSPEQYAAAWPHGTPPGVYASVRAPVGVVAPDHDRLRVVATPELADDAPALVSDTSDLEQVIVEFARAQVPADLGDLVAAEAKAVWRNA